MHSSPINSLQVECSDPPLWLRRQLFADKFILKCLNSKCHPVIPRVALLCDSTHSSTPSRSQTKLLPAICKNFQSLSDLQIIQNDLLPLFKLKYSHVTLSPTILEGIGIFKSHSKLPARTVNNMFNDIISSKWPNFSLLFTDGSKSSVSPNCGIGINVYHNNSNDRMYHSISNLFSIFSAECIAIIESLKYIIKNNLEHSLVFSDSLSSLQKLKSSPLLYPDDDFVCLIRVLIASIQSSGKTITLIWIPGHVGIVGNDIADSLAKQGASNPIITLINHIPLSDIFSILKEKTRNVWAEHWHTASQSKGAYYASIQGDIPSKPWFQQYPHFSKKEVSTLIRMRIGHCSVPSHLFKIHVLDSPDCSHCGLEVGTLDHIFFGCPSLNKYPLFYQSLCKIASPPFNISSLLSLNSTPIIRIILKFINLNNINI